MRLLAVVLLATLLFASGIVLPSLSNGYLPPAWTGSPQRYSDQYNGSNGAPNNGRAHQGDTARTVWALSGTLFMSCGDCSAFSVSGFANGCNNGGGTTGANLAISSYSASTNAGSNVNCMSSYGNSAQTNTGGWSDGRNWKPGGGMDVNDGVTTTGLYWWVSRSATGPPFGFNAPSLMLSTDAGVTWTNPAGSSNTNGAAPAASTSMFTSSSIGEIVPVQFEQGWTGAITKDGNNSYIYCMMDDTSRSQVMLMRAARGGNLQQASSWQAYTGAVGGNIATGGNWATANSATPTVLIAIGNVPQVTWISGTGLYVANDTDGSGNTVIYQATTLTGPWTLVFSEPPVPGALYANYGINLSTLTTQSANPFRATAKLSMTGSYTIATSNPATNPYGLWTRTITIANPGGSAIGAKVTLGSRVTIQ